MRYNFAADSFYIMKLCSRLFILYYRSRSIDDRSRHFDPHFEEVRGGTEPWWMARWKARVEFLLSVIELLFLSLTVEALQGKMCHNSLPSGVARSLGAKISGEGVVPGECFLVSTKLDTFCYPRVKLHRATCRRFDTISACDGQTDRQPNRQTEFLLLVQRLQCEHCGAL